MHTLLNGGAWRCCHSGPSRFCPARAAGWCLARACQEEAEPGRESVIGCPTCKSRRGLARPKDVIQLPRDEDMSGAPIAVEKLRQPDLRQPGFEPPSVPETQATDFPLLRRPPDQLVSVKEELRLQVRHGLEQRVRLQRQHRKQRRKNGQVLAAGEKGFGVRQLWQRRAPVRIQHPSSQQCLQVGRQCRHALLQQVLAKLRRPVSVRPEFGPLPVDQRLLPLLPVLPLALLLLQLRALQLTVLADKA